MSKIKYFPEDMDVQNKRIMLRLDLNVPLDKKEIQDKNRLTRIEVTVLLSYQEGLKGESGTLNVPLKNQIN